MSANSLESGASLYQQNNEGVTPLNNLEKEFPDLLIMVESFGRMIDFDNQSSHGNLASESSAQETERKSPKENDECTTQ